MTTSDLVWSIILVTLTAFSGWAGTHEGLKEGRAAAETEIRAEAIEAGAARWTIDEKTGERHFEWLKPEAGQ